MTRLVYCEPGAHDVTVREAVQIDGTDTAVTGPGPAPRWACRAHLGGIVPKFIGRRDAAPIAPGGQA